MLIEHLSIIGVGLIGGSLARALRQAKLVGRVTGCNRNEETLKQAMDLNVIDDYSMDVAEAVRYADVVVVGTPLSTSVSLLPKIAEAMSNRTILTDVGSAKGSIVDAARNILGKRINQFVPGHPIAGTEQSGVGASYAELFVKHRVILTPLPENNDAAIRLITEMWQAVGADVINLEVKHHDDVLAATSHLPHMLAYALVDCLAGMEEREEVFKYAAGGFADFTRIASSSPEMWHDICLSNQASLLESVKLFSEHLQTLQNAIEQKDSVAILKIFQRAKQARDKFAHKKLV